MKRFHFGVITDEIDQDFDRACRVAAELGMTVNAVHLAKARVLRRLRGELAGLWE